MGNGLSSNALTTSDSKRISVVIPSLNEEGRVGKAVKSTIAKGGTQFCEVIVVDGGSADQTVAEARKAGAKVVSSKPGRGVQLNEGSRVAQGDVLMFLHADSTPPDGFVKHIIQALDSTRGAQWGCFKTIHIQPPIFGSGLISCLVELRVRFLGMPYGDQGIFIRKQYYRQVGGFANWPLMEDVDFVMRMRKHSRMALVPHPITTSARRWQKLGVVKTTLLNQLTMMSWLLGASPEVLARCYYDGTFDAPRVVSSILSNMRNRRGHAVGTTADSSHSLNSKP